MGHVHCGRCIAVIFMGDPIPVVLGILVLWINKNEFIFVGDRTDHFITSSDMTDHAKELNLMLNHCNEVVREKKMVACFLEKLCGLRKFGVEDSVAQDFHKLWID